MVMKIQQLYLDYHPTFLFQIFFIHTEVRQWGPSGLRGGQGKNRR